MSVVFHCPNCGVERTAARFIQGHRVRCPGCEQMVEVPAEIQDDGDDPEAAAELIVLTGSEDALGDPAEAAASLTPLASQPEDETPHKVKLRESRELVDSEMDMTPMVDVTFLLLIFFMVTAVFVLQKSIQIPKPEAPEENVQQRSFQELEDDPEYVTVHVEPLGTYRVVTVDWDVDVFSEAELLRKLMEARRGVAGGVIPKHLLVRADGEAGHGKVVSALDSGTAVGMEDVQLLTVEEE